MRAGVRADACISSAVKLFLDNEWASAQPPFHSMYSSAARLTMHTDDLGFWFDCMAVAMGLVHA